MRTTLVKVLGAVSALSIAAGFAHAAGTDDLEPVNCIDLMRIDHTDIVDNQNILFYMRNGGIYVNRLAHPLPRLEDEEAFSYRTSIGRLCSLDTITVLERWGFGLTEGASSTLGQFRPVDEDGANALLNGQ